VTRVATLRSVGYELDVSSARSGVLIFAANFPLNPHSIILLLLLG
jgi:hypothetical protein